MHPETRALAAATAVVAAVFLLALFLQLPSFVIFLFGSQAAALAVLGILFLPKYPVRNMRATPEASLGFLARHFRLTGYRVAESPGALIIRLGPHSAVRVVARPTPTGCGVRYQAYATPSGWGTLITFILLGWTALPGLALAVYGFLRARSFASGSHP